MTNFYTTGELNQLDGKKLLILGGAYQHRKLLDVYKKL